MPTVGHGGRHTARLRALPETDGSKRKTGPWNEYDARVNANLAQISVDEVIGKLLHERCVRWRVQPLPLAFCE